MLGMAIGCLHQLGTLRVAPGALRERLTFNAGKLVGRSMAASTMVSAGLGFAPDLALWSGVVGTGPHQRDYPANESPAENRIEDADSILIPMPPPPRHDSWQKVDY